MKTFEITVQQDVWCWGYQYRRLYLKEKAESLDAAASYGTNNSKHSTSCSATSKTASAYGCCKSV